MVTSGRSMSLLIDIYIYRYRHRYKNICVYKTFTIDESGRAHDEPIGHTCVAINARDLLAMVSAELATYHGYMVPNQLGYPLWQCLFSLSA